MAPLPRPPDEEYWIRPVWLHVSPSVSYWWEFRGWYAIDHYDGHYVWPCAVRRGPREPQAHWPTTDILNYFPTRESAEEALAKHLLLRAAAAEGG